MTTDLNSRQQTALNKSNRKTYYSRRKNILFEAGVFIQPSLKFRQSVPDADNIYYTTAGISLGLRKGSFLFETGVGFSKLNYNESLLYEYYEYEFLGTVISMDNYKIITYLDENGDTVSEKKYYAEWIDVYDSTLSNDETQARMIQSLVSIPFTIGYRLWTNGRFFTDIKTGPGLTIITAQDLEWNKPEDTYFKIISAQQNLTSNFFMKWNYHLSVDIGWQINEHIILYGEPGINWEFGAQTSSGTSEVQLPCTLQFRFGFKWAF